MAKADGLVTRDEVTAFRQVFHIPASETQNAARVFDLARKDVAGFDLYAARIRDMFGAGHQALVDLLEGLFYIAVADGVSIRMKTYFWKRWPAFSVCNRAISSTCARALFPMKTQIPIAFWGLIPLRMWKPCVRPGVPWYGNIIPIG